MNGVLGTRLAPIAFAVALLAAGQSSTITGTLSGQIVMEGFLNMRMRPWLRRIVTRGIALVPAVIVIALAGDKGLYRLLILSQVVLSLQLPFATIPLIHFTSDRQKMGVFANRMWVKILAWVIAAVIVALNLKLVFDELTGWLGNSPAWVWVIVMIPVILMLAILAYITFGPLLRPGRRWDETITSDAHLVQHAPGDGVIISSAVAEAKVHKARITLLHVVDAPGTLMLGNESWSRHGAEDQSYLESLAREIEEKDLPVEFLLLHGQPADGASRHRHSGAGGAQLRPGAGATLLDHLICQC